MVQLKPEGKRNLLEQCLRFEETRTDCNGDAINFLKFMLISKRFTAVSRRYHLNSLGLCCIDDFGFKLYIARPKAFNENYGRMLEFKTVETYGLARKLIIFINPSFFICHFYHEYWWNKFSNLLNHLKPETLIDMVCYVGSSFMLTYQMTPFWHYNIRNLKFICKSGFDSVAMGTSTMHLILSYVPVTQFITYIGPDYSNTAETIEIEHLDASEVKTMIQAVKSRCPKLRWLTIECKWKNDLRLINHTDLEGRRTLEVIQRLCDDIAFIKDTICKNWLLEFKLRMKVNVTLASFANDDSYNAQIREIPFFRDVDVSIVNNVNSIEYNYQSHFLDNKFDIDVQLLICKQNHEILVPPFVHAMRMANNFQQILHD